MAAGWRITCRKSKDRTKETSQEATAMVQMGVGAGNSGWGFQGATVWLCIRKTSRLQAVQIWKSLDAIKEVSAL